MNKILLDLKKSINSISRFYYDMPTVFFEDDNLNIDFDDIKYYERRFVAQLKSEYDKLIINGATGNYKEVNTDLEVIKKYIYTENPDQSIKATYNKLCNENNKIIKSITTIPDFFIHKHQNEKNNINQKLIVEVKTKPNIDENDFFLDLFKLNIYVEKYNFQNGVFLILNNEITRVQTLAKNYLKRRLYLAPINRDRIYFYIKSSFQADIKTIKFIDI